MKYKEKIITNGLSMTFVANKIGVNLSTLSNYLNGYREMPEEVEKKLINLLKQYPNA